MNGASREDLNMVDIGSATSAQKAVLSCGSCTIANSRFANMAFDGFVYDMFPATKQAKYITGSCSSGKFMA